MRLIIYIANWGYQLLGTPCRTCCLTLSLFVFCQLRNSCLGSVQTGQGHQLWLVNIWFGRSCSIHIFKLGKILAEAHLFYSVSDRLTFCNLKKMIFCLSHNIIMSFISVFRGTVNRNNFDASIEFHVRECCAILIWRMQESFYVPWDLVEKGTRSQTFMLETLTDLTSIS